MLLLLWACQGLLALLIVGSIVFYVAGAIATRQFFQKKQPPLLTQTPPVSIMVPVCGLEPDSWGNWSSFCVQDYPNYEVLFGVVDPQDPAIPILRQVLEAFPHCAKLFVGLKPRGINFKDSSLSYLLEEAQHETLIFADGDIRVEPDYIRTFIAPLEQTMVGMVTCVYIGFQPQSLDAALASLGRAIDFIPSLLLARILDRGLRCAVGVTIATRRDAFNRYGGLQLNRIGSDYNIGKRCAGSGYRVELPAVVLESDTGREGLGNLCKRELRWARTIRFNRGPQYYTMAFCYGTVYALLLLLLTGGAPWAVALAIATWLVRYTTAIATLQSLRAPKLLPWLIAIPLRDGLSFGVWVLGSWGRSVVWRGRRLRIEGDGLIREVN
jgi:ceramide glucosyltransferase